MTATRLFSLTVIAAVILAIGGNAQPPSPKPGPEHAHLKTMEGTWDTTMKMHGSEEKGIATYKMDVGGLWLASTYEGTIGGQKFSGRGFDTYDADKQKFIGVWIDSMSATPMMSEGTYDKAKKTMTMSGVGPGKDGPKTKHRMVTEKPDDNTVNFTMYMGDVDQPDFTIVYKRKK